MWYLKFTCENNSFKIFRIELENSNLIVTTEKQAREMEALWEKLLNAGAEAVSQLMSLVWKEMPFFLE